MQQSLAAVAELTGHQSCGRGKRIVVVGWPGNIRDLTDGIADFAPPGSQVRQPSSALQGDAWHSPAGVKMCRRLVKADSMAECTFTMHFSWGGNAGNQSTVLQVTVISRGRPADLPEGEEAGCTFRHVDGSTTMASSYANAGLATADAVIIGAAPPLAALHTYTK